MDRSIEGFDILPHQLIGRLVIPMGQLQLILVIVVGVVVVIVPMMMVMMMMMVVFSSIQKRVAGLRAVE